MRIAYFFLDRPNYTAGPRINAMRVLPELVSRGHEVTALIGYRDACPAKEDLEKTGVFVRERVWPEHTEDQVRWFYDQLAEIDPDLFVPNISVSGCYAGRYLREAGRPTILGHLSDDSHNWGLARRFVKRRDRWAVSGLFCCGAGLAETVRSWGSTRTQVVEIPAGVPLPPKVVSQEGPLKLVYAGRMEERQKRVSDLAKAVAGYLDRDPAARFEMVGDGAASPSVASFVGDRGLNDRIRLTGYVPPDEVQGRIADNNVFVLLSDYEGIPGAVMDAMACGLVPVCLDIGGGLGELVIHEQTGLLVPDRESSFHEALHRLATDQPLRARLAENARRHVEQRFSLKVAVDLWEQFFDELLAEAGPRRPLRFPSKPKLPYPDYSVFTADLRARKPSWLETGAEAIGNPRRTLGWLKNWLGAGE